MYKEPKTIYQAARISAGLTQEASFPLLHVSLESLRAYESGRTVPSDVVVAAMVEQYQCPWLAWAYLKTANEVGKRFLPDMELCDLAPGMLMLQREISHINTMSADMIEIVCDNQVSENEKEKWERGLMEIRHFITAGLALMFATEKKRKPPVLSHRRLGQGNF